MYITDQNHGYEDVDLPIGVQMWKNEPVSIGDGSWLGHGAVVLPGSRIGKHVVVAAGAVVAGLDVPDFSVVAGVPARVVRRYVAGEGWVPVPRERVNGYPLCAGAFAGTGCVFGSSSAGTSFSPKTVTVPVGSNSFTGVVGHWLGRYRWPPSTRRYMPVPCVPVSSWPGGRRVPVEDAGVVEPHGVVAVPEAVLAVGHDAHAGRRIRGRRGRDGVDTVLE